MSDSRLLAAFRALLPALLPREPFAYPRRYRVVGMKPAVESAKLTRVELQIVQKATGFPDMLMIEQWSGAAGASAELAPGSMVLVQFIDGDREQPIVTHYSMGARDPVTFISAWRPVTLEIDASTTIKLGASATKAAAREGDTVDIGTLTYTGPGSLVWVHPDPSHVPPTYTSPTPMPLEGLVSSGSGKTVIE